MNEGVQFYHRLRIGENTWNDSKMQDCGQWPDNTDVTDHLYFVMVVLALFSSEFFYLTNKNRDETFIHSRKTSTLFNLLNFNHTFSLNVIASSTKKIYSISTVLFSHLEKCWRFILLPWKYMAGFTNFYAFIVTNKYLKLDVVWKHAIKHFITQA